MHRAHARFDSARGFEPWARRIATHAALDWLRRQKPESSVAPEMWVNVAAPSTGDAAVAADIRRKTELAFATAAGKAAAGCGAGSRGRRPHKEVAEALGITVAAVKLRVFRALRLLRKDLQEQGITP